MKTKELNLDKLADYITKNYGNDVKYLATELRKLAIDYGRLNAYISVKEDSNSISEESYNYITTLDNIADALEQKTY